MENVYALEIGEGESKIVITPPAGYAPVCSGQNCEIDYIWSVIRFGINLVLIIGVALALIFLIIGGIKYIMSGGDKQATESAKGTITNALIGLVLLVSSFVILMLIQNLTGINLGLPGA